MEISNSIVSIFEPLKKIMENKPEKLTPEKILKTQSIISEFFLSTDTITVEEALVSWNVLHDLACNTYTVTKTSESAVLAENLSGLLLWKLQHDWSKNITNELSNLSKLLENFNSEKSISKITSSGLRTSARFGPSNMYRLVGEWIEIFRNVFFNIHDKNPDNMLDTQLVESLDIFFDPLIGKKFEILYDMPFVQEGLRIVSNSVNWILPFSAIIKRTREQTLTPLTRSLYIIALVDEYFINGNNQNSKSLLTHQFKKNMQYIDEKVFIPLNKVNLSPKTSNEVQIGRAHV